jgi:hypothetical protein
VAFLEIVEELLQNGGLENRAVETWGQCYKFVIIFGGIFFMSEIFIENSAIQLLLHILPVNYLRSGKFRLQFFF